MSIRESKSARLKLKILEAALSLVGKKSFDSLYVDQICERVGTSKVTLFKYFAQKDDILLYYLRVWCLERAVEQYEKPKEGLTAILELFDKMAITFEKRPGLMLSLISYFTSMNRPPVPLSVKQIERTLLHPKVENLDKIEILSINQMLEKYVLEAIFKGDIKGYSDTKDLANIFSTLLFGSIVTCHLRQIDNVRVFFRSNINTMLRGLSGS